MGSGADISPLTKRRVQPNCTQITHWQLTWFFRGIHFFLAGGLDPWHCGCVVSVQMKKQGQHFVISPFAAWIFEWHAFKTCLRVIFEFVCASRCFALAASRKVGFVAGAWLCEAFAGRFCSHRRASFTWSSLCLLYSSFLQHVCATCLTALFRYSPTLCLYNASLQHSSPTLFNNTVQELSTTLVPNTSGQHLLWQVFATLEVCLPDISLNRLLQAQRWVGDILNVQPAFRCAYDWSTGRNWADVANSGHPLRIVL